MDFKHEDDFFKHEVPLRVIDRLSHMKFFLLFSFNGCSDLFLSYGKQIHTVFQRNQVLKRKRNRNLEFVYISKEYNFNAVVDLAIQNVTVHIDKEMYKLEEE